jgi:hypothetical protein
MRFLIRVAAATAALWLATAIIDGIDGIDGIDVSGPGSEAA